MQKEQKLQHITNRKCEKGDNTSEDGEVILIPKAHPKLSRFSLEILEVLGGTCSTMFLIFGNMIGFTYQLDGMFATFEVLNEKSQAIGNYTPWLGAFAGCGVISLTANLVGRATRSKKGWIERD